MKYARYPSYRNTGVPWLGEVPAHWSVLPAKYRVAALSGGQVIKNTVSREPEEGLFPAFSASGQDVWTPEYDFDCPAIVLSAVGARSGKTFKADGKWSAIANTHCLFPRGADRDFLWYLTNNEQWWERGGTAQPFVKVSETLARKWTFPPVDEQRAITAFLDRETARIDALIEKKRRLIELLQERRATAITQAVLRGVDAHAYMADSSVSWLGRLPRHWGVIRLKFLTRSIRSGKTPTGGAEVYEAEGVPVDDHRKLTHLDGV